MMSRRNKRGCPIVDYNQLNSLSSVVLYDTVFARKLKKTQLYAVERVIERGKVVRPHDYEYLIKWEDWAYESCTLEPTNHLTAECLRSYENPPKPSQKELEDAARLFKNGILSHLKSRAISTCYIDNFHLNMWRYIVRGKGEPTGDHRGSVLLQRIDFSRFSSLSGHWWYSLNEHGEGVAIDFPVKIKQLLSWSPKHFTFNGQAVVQAPKEPKEKLCVTLASKPCNVNNLFFIGNTISRTM